MKPWLDCPVCVECHAPTMCSRDGETDEPLPGTSLECRACGARRRGTEGERQQAERADAAWEAEQQRWEAERRRKAEEHDEREWLAAAGSAARPAPQPREEPESLPLPGVKL